MILCLNFKGMSDTCRHHFIKIPSEEGGEPVADLLVKTSELHGTVVGGSIIPTLIDELPVIALMACFAKGKTIIKDAHELRVKESDRIAIMTENLTEMGADVIDTDDGFIINSRSEESILFFMEPKSTVLWITVSP